MLEFMDTPDYPWLCDQLAMIRPEVYQASEPNAFIETMEDWRRNIYYIGTAVQYIINGGVETYIEGSHGDEVEPLLKSLEVIGANEFIKMMNAVKSHFPGGVIPVESEERIRCLDRIQETYGGRYLSDLNEGGLDEDIFQRIRSLEPRS